MTPKMMQTEATARPAFRPQRSTIGPTIGPPRMHPALMIAELRPVRSLLSLKSDIHNQKSIFGRETFDIRSTNGLTVFRLLIMPAS